MKLSFQKGYNKEFPKRWYVLGDSSYIRYASGILNAGTSFPLHFDSSYASYAVRTKLLQLGLNPIKDTSSDPNKYSRNASHRIFLYFKSHAEEAAFIVNASAGIEVDV